MHRVDGFDFIIEAGKRRFKSEVPAVSEATQITKFILNALQEETALVIENIGLTLNASGSADRTAGWGQLDQAIQKIITERNTKFIEGFHYSLMVGGDVSIQAGKCNDSLDQEEIKLAGGLTKKTNDPGVNPWSAGHNGFAVPTGVTLSADAWYNLFIIKDSSTGDVDAGVDDSGVASNLLTASGFDLYRRIGVMKYSGGSPVMVMYAGFSTNDEFNFRDVQTEQNNVTVPVSSTNIAVNFVPTNIINLGHFNFILESQTPGTVIGADLYHEDGVSALSSGLFTAYKSGGNFNIINRNNLLKWNASAGSPVAKGWIHTRGFTDYRGKVGSIIF